MFGRDDAFQAVEIMFAASPRILTAQTGLDLHHRPQPNRLLLQLLPPLPLLLD